MSYSRDAENEADQTALELMERGRVDPRGLIGFFERQALALRRLGGGEAELWLRINSSHPHPGDRALSLRDGAARYARSFSALRIEVDFEGLKSRLNQITAAPPSR